MLLFAGLLAGCWESNAGGLTGRPTDTPASFHFLGRSAPCHMELPGVPRSVRVNCFHVDGALHIHSNRFADVPRLRGESWVNVVRRDPEVRVEINGRIYALTAILIADESQRQALLLARGYWRAWDGITIFRFAKSSG